MGGVRVREAADVFVISDPETSNPETSIPNPEPRKPKPYPFTPKTAGEIEQSSPRGGRARVRTRGRDRHLVRGHRRVPDVDGQRRSRQYRAGTTDSFNPGLKHNVWGLKCVLCANRRALDL